MITNKGISIILLAAAFTSHNSSAEPIISANSYISQHAYDYIGNMKENFNINNHETLSDNNLESFFRSQGSSEEYSNLHEYFEAGMIAPNQWTSINANTGSIKAHSHSFAPRPEETQMGHPAETRITEVASVLSFQNLTLDISEGGAETTFSWDIDGYLQGLAGYGAAIDVTLTNIETGNITNEFMTTMDTTLNYQTHYNWDQTYTSADVYNRLSTTFDLIQGSYILDVTLGFTAISVTGDLSDYEYTFNGDVYEIIDDGSWRYSDESIADLSHTATFNISSPTLENITLDTGNLSQVLAPQIQQLTTARANASDENNNNPVSVPEPNSLYLLALTLLALQLRRR